MAHYIVSDQSLGSIADAIRVKGHTENSVRFPDGFINAIQAIRAGGDDSLSANSVNMCDFDGTVVHAYTAGEFLQLDTLPDNTAYGGMRSLGWNWDLIDAKAFVTAHGRLDIGQMYASNDGKTHIWMHIDPSTPQNRMRFYLRWTQTESNGVEVDWGDGGEAETFSGTGAANHAHVYAEPGDYEITLAVTGGTMSFDGNSTGAGNAIYGSKGNTNSFNRQRITKIVVGDSVTAIGDGAFQLCYGLRYVVLGNSVASIGANAFQSCYSLKYAVIPKSVNSIGDNAFEQCYSIVGISMANGITSIGNNAFQYCGNMSSATIPDTVAVIGEGVMQYCYSLGNVVVPGALARMQRGFVAFCYGLTAMTIPANVTAIETNAFQSCYGIGEYHMLSPTPPTLSSASAFSNIASDCVIYVPYSADHSVLNSYKSATNWSTYADIMREEEQ